LEHDKYIEPPEFSVVEVSNIELNISMFISEIKIEPPPIKPLLFENSEFDICMCYISWLLLDYVLYMHEP